MSAGPDALPAPAVRARYVLRLADTSLVLAQRLSEWIGHAPALEEELGLANIALDLLGQARALLTYAAELEGRGRSEDDLAYLRGPGEFLNPTLAEQPNRDFAAAIVRQVLLDAFQMAVYEGLAGSEDSRLAEIAAKSLAETRYHLRYSSGWLARLGDGTEESRGRVGVALGDLWRFTGELTASDEIDEAMAAARLAPLAPVIAARWSALIGDALAEAALERPAAARPSDLLVPCGRRGEHTEHLTQLLSEMQHLPRLHPGARW